MRGISCEFLLPGGFYLVKNHKIAKNSRTTKAREKNKHRLGIIRVYSVCVWLNLKTIKFYLTKLATDLYCQTRYLLGEIDSFRSLSIWYLWILPFLNKWCLFHLFEDTSASWCQCYETFFLRKVFVPQRPFHPSLMLAGKACQEPTLSGITSETCSTWVGPDLTSKHNTRLERLARDLHSSLLCPPWKVL